MGQANQRGYQYHKAGLNSVGSYQMSGVPFMSSSIQVPSYSAASGYGYKLEFPTVTKAVTVRNDGTDVLWFAFSANAISGSTGVGGHRVSVPSSGSVTVDFRVVDVYLISDTTTAGKATVIAPLTGITRDQLVNNWSGSAAVHHGLI